MCNSFNKKFLDEAAKKRNKSEEIIPDHQHFIEKSLELAIKSVNKNNGGPFGCVVVKDGKIIGKGFNQVTSLKDPTAHAEIVAIREACKYLNDFQLTDCIIYTSCEPCPMCLGAIYWARPKKVFYASEKTSASKAGFDDSFIYKEIELPHAQRSIPFENIQHPKSFIPFENWKEKEDKIKY